MIADWKKAYKDTIEFEGGYANHPNDLGGETYKGVARKIWSKWRGWKILDEYKANGITSARELTRVMALDSRVEPLVADFYKRNFWDRIHGDELPSRLSRKAFDVSVNMGARWGIRLLQKALNAIRIVEEIMAGKLFDDLDEDGVYGKKTLNAINAIFELHGKDTGSRIIVEWYCSFQAERYYAIINRNPSQRVFLKGWLKRAAYTGD